MNSKLRHHNINSPVAKNKNITDKRDEEIEHRIIARIEMNP